MKYAKTTRTNSDTYYFSKTTEKDTSKNTESSINSHCPSIEEINLIHRKTYRGRKEKIPFPKNKPKCGICLKFSHPSKEELISCNTCKCLFHKSCFDKYESYDNAFYRCIRCIHATKLNKSVNDFKCFICNSSKGVIDIDINHIDGPFYHKVCLDLLIEFKGLKRNEIRKEKVRKWRFKNSCRYCGEKLSKNKAVIKCKNPRCKEYYHIPCAIEKGVLFDLNYMQNFYHVRNTNEIPIFCSNHNKKISFMYKKYIMNLDNNLNNDYNFENRKENEISEEKSQKKCQDSDENEIYMSIDDEFEINKSKAFNLDFWKINLENINSEYNIVNDELIINNYNSDNNYCFNEYFKLNSNFPTLNNNNIDNDSLYII